MKDFGPFPRRYDGGKKYIMLAIPKGLPVFLRNAVLLLAVVGGSNYATYRLSHTGEGGEVLASFSGIASGESSLYMMDKARVFVRDVPAFEGKVREVSSLLSIPPEWLMAVMYAESNFDATVYNHKGSGAVGLIQFMPTTALELNVTSERLSNMEHVQQLEYVYRYLEKKKQEHGPYGSLTDLYLAILYPKARNQDACYTLFSRPSRAYSQNSGLDENKDGRITVSDIDRRMARLFPSAYTLDANGKSDSNDMVY